MKNILILIIVSQYSILNTQFSFAQTYPAQNISFLSNWSDSTVVSEPQHGIKYNGVFGWSHPVDNREYAIIGSTAGTYFIEVTNPTQPVLRDFVPGRRDSCIWREIQTYQNFCYLVSDDALPNSFQIVDLLPLPDSVHLVHDSTNIISRCHTIFIDGDKLYGGSPKGPFGQSSMAVFSLKNNPASPFLLRRLEEDYSGMDNTHDMFVRNDTIYASMSYSGFFVFIFDTLSNKFNLVNSLTTYPFEGYNHSSSLTENGNISIMCDEVGAGLPVKVVDVSDLMDITVVSTFQSNPGSTPHNPYVVGNDRVVIAYYQDGIQVYDISDTANPIRTGYFDTRPEIGDNNGYPGDPYQGCWGAYTKLPSGNLLASDMQNGLFVLDASVALGTNQTQINSNNFFERFQIYPNPGNGKFEVLSWENGAYGLITIYNIFEKKIYQQIISSTNRMVDISAQPEGMYFLKISGKDFVETKKILKADEK